MLETPNLRARLRGPWGHPVGTSPPKCRLQGQAAPARAPKASPTVRSRSHGCSRHGNTVTIFKNHSLQSSSPKHGVSPLRYPCANPGFRSRGHRRGDLPARRGDFGEHLESGVVLKAVCRCVRNTLFYETPFPSGFRRTFIWTKHFGFHSSREHEQHDVKMPRSACTWAESMWLLVRHMPRCLQTHPPRPPPRPREDVPTQRPHKARRPE